MQNTVQRLHRTRCKFYAFYLQKQILCIYIHIYEKVDMIKLRKLINIVKI